VPNRRPRVARAARLLPVRQPRCRHGGDRDRTAVALAGIGIEQAAKKVGLADMLHKMYVLWSQRSTIRCAQEADVGLFPQPAKSRPTALDPLRTFGGSSNAGPRVSPILRKAG
jgi:hypothetical protein